MNKIDPDVLNEIKDRLDIAEVASRYLAIKRTGQGFKALCPFHQEKTPSFNLSPQKKIFHCFGCGQGGDIFRLVMELEKIGFSEAVTKLAAEAGVTLKGASAELSEQDKKRIRMLAINEKVCELYQRALTPENRAYLQQRDITREDIAHFKIGFAPPAGTYLTRELSGEDKFWAGEVGTIRSDAGRHYDFFRNRIIFPIFNESGKTVGFSGRVLRSEDSPKYINIAQNPVFDKSRILYGLHIARKFCGEKNEIIITEGYTDVIAMHRFGFKNCVATMGTALTDMHLNILSRFAETLVLLFDGDPAGTAAAARGIDKALARNFKIKIVVLPEDLDPDDFLKKYGAARMADCLNRGQDYLAFMFEREYQNGDTGTVQGKLTIIKNLMPLLKKIPMDFDRMVYAENICSRLDFGRDILLRQLDGRPAESAPAPAGVRYDGDPEIKLLALLCHGDHDTFAYINQFLHADFFSSVAAGELYTLLNRQFYENGFIDLAGLRNTLPDGEQLNIITFLEMSADDFLNKQASAGYLMKRIVDRRLTARVEDKKKRMKTAPDESGRELLLRETGDLMKMKKDLFQAMDSALSEERT